MKRYFMLVLLVLISHNTFSQETGIKHIVLCWLHDANNPAILTSVVEASRQLESIAQVNNIIVGRPVPSERDIVDDSFDVGLVLDFHNQQSLAQYLVHEDHVRRVKEVLAPNCKRILIYDIAY